jgi:hypothetical protein
MNNNFYTIVKQLRDSLEENPLVNTLIYARTEDKDLLKDNIYPLAHLNPVSSPWTNEASNEFTFEVGVFNQRTKDNRNKDTKFEGNDNVIDNHNTCYSIINEFLTELSKDNRKQIYMTSVSDISPLFLQDSNGLDGWFVTVSFKMINTLDVS